MASDFDFREVFVQLGKMGVMDTVLPFLLIFTVLFTIFDRTKMLGSDKKNANIVIALVISLIVLIPHVTGGYPKGQDPIQILNTALPSVSVILIAIIMLLVLIGAFGAELGIGEGLIGIVALASLGIIIWIFGSAAGWFSGMPDFLKDSATQSWLIVALTAGVVIFLVVGGGGGSGISNIFSGLNKVMRTMK